MMIVEQHSFIIIIITIDHNTTSKYANNVAFPQVIEAEENKPNNRGNFQ